MDQKLSEIIQAATDEARASGLDEADQFWLAVGAVNAAAREQGLIGDELPPEFNAAAMALVKEELSK